MAKIESRLSTDQQIYDYCHQVGTMYKEVGHVNVTANTENNYTGKQRGALHVWCDMCAKVLNEAGIYLNRKSVFGDHDIEILWTGILFKEHVYKHILNAMTGLDSTEDQKTVTPTDVSQVISKQYSENGLICPPWPSAR